MFFVYIVYSYYFIWHYQLPVSVCVFIAGAYCTQLISHTHSNCGRPWRMAVDR